MPSQPTPQNQGRGPVKPNPLAGAADPVSFLIIAPEPFMAAAQPLAEHKNQTGMSAMAVSIGGLIGFFPGADDPEKIKRGIQYAFERLQTRFVMLVGDGANFPVRFWFDWNLTVPGYPGGITPKYPNGQNIPCDPMGTYIQSDLYYASIYHHTGTYPNLQPGEFDDWDKSGAGLLNQAWRDNSILIAPPALNTSRNPDEVDGYPDLAVGRLPARNATDVTNYVNKVIAYETRTSSKLPRFTFVADQLYPGSVPLTTGIISQAGLQNKAVDFTYLLFENQNLDLPGTGALLVTPPPPFVTVNMTADITKAAGASAWLSYVGHGSAEGLGEADGFTFSDLAGMKELSGLPVVFVAGCQTSLFMNNLPWGTAVPFIDIDGKKRGPFQVAFGAEPEDTGPTIFDQSTLQNWGTPPPASLLPLPVPTPKPNPINVPNACWANPWLFDNCPGGAIGYFGAHCVASDSYPVSIHTNMLKAYCDATSAPVLGSIYLTAQQQYWAGPDSSDAATAGLPDYHGIPRLYLGWLVFFGDPSLRLPSLPVKVTRPDPLTGKLDQPIVLQRPGGGSQTLAGIGGPTIVEKPDK